MGRSERWIKDLNYSSASSVTGRYLLCLTEKILSGALLKKKYLDRHHRMKSYTHWLNPALRHSPRHVESQTDSFMTVFLNLIYFELHGKLRLCACCT